MINSMINSIMPEVSFATHDKYSAAATSNLELYPSLHTTVCEPIWLAGHHQAEADHLQEIAGKAFAVMRYSGHDFKPVGYVAGLAGNAGSWEVRLNRADAFEQSERLNYADDGCYYLAEQYIGE